MCLGEGVVGFVFLFFFEGGGNGILRSNVFLSYFWEFWRILRSNDLILVCVCDFEDVLGKNFDPQGLV